MDKIDNSNELQEAKSLLTHAKFKIQELRHENEILSAQVKVVNIFERALFGNTNYPGAEIDVCWQIDNFLESKKMSYDVDDKPF